MFIVVLLKLLMGKIMKYDIEYKNSRWLVNQKRLEDMNQDEKDFMDDFFREFKSKIELYEKQ